MERRSPHSILLPALVLFGTLALVFVSARSSRPPAPIASYSMGHGPTIVLVHGLGSRIEHWLPVARKLARTNRVVLVELPGHGESAMTEPLTLERAAAALEGTLAREAHEPVTLVGHSVGGLVAAKLALDHPRLVRALVLIETSLKPAMDDRERLGLLDQLDHDYQGLVAGAYASFGSDSVQGRKLAAEAESQDPKMMKPWIRLALTADLSADAGELHLPVIAAFSDRSWPRDEAWAACAKELGYERIPQVEPVRFEGCGHFVMLDRPTDVARLIARVAGGEGEIVGASHRR